MSGDRTTLAAKALDMFETQTRTTSIRRCVLRADRTAKRRQDWPSTITYHFSDGSWLSTRGRGRAHEVTIGQ